MEKNNDPILHLFAAYFTGEITDAEAKKLTDWLQELPENKAQFLEYVSLFEKTKKIYFIETLNQEKAWNSVVINLKTPFRATLKKKKENIIFFQKSWFKYAVAAVFVGVIFSTYFFNTNFKSSQEANSKHFSTIVQGSSKAKLTLENGTEVLLKKGIVYNSNNINSNGENIVYENDKVTKSEKIAYNYLTIPRGGQFLIQLSDGTKVWLNSESKIKYPTNFINGKSRSVELIYGEAYFNVSSSKKHKGASFKVFSKGQAIEVLGTEFNVKSYRNESITYSTLVEGKIALETSNRKLFLKPQEQAVVNQQNGDIQVVEINVRSEISWKDGVFSFRGKTLKNVMKVLSRWYDVEVVFETRNLERKTFKGILDKNQKIEDILVILKNASSLKSYEIKGKKIILK